MAKIKSIEYFRVLPRWLFVKICDEQGGYGWGEATLEGHTEAVEGNLNALIKRFVGYEAKYCFPTKTCLCKANDIAVTSNTYGRMYIELRSTEVARL
jgi:hypothetical protein